MCVGTYVCDSNISSKRACLILNLHVEKFKDDFTVVKTQKMLKNSPFDSEKFTIYNIWSANTKVWSIKYKTQVSKIGLTVKNLSVA